MTTLATTRRTSRPATAPPTSAVRRPWLETLHARHARVATVLTLGGVVAIAVVPAPSIFGQLALLAVLLAMIGMPHGAADHLPMQRVLRPRFGAAWLPVFVLGYASVAGLTLWSWLALPPLLLTIFLALAVLHFGNEDAPRSLYPLPWVRRIALPLHGLIPVAGPALFHPEETAMLFSWLLPGTSEVTVLGVLHAGTSAIPMLLWSWALLVLLHVSRWKGRNKRAAAEVVTLVLLFAVAPPLVAFAVYFCGWHAVRHILAEGYALDPVRPRHGILLFLHHAMPVTVATITLGVAGYLLVASGMQPDVALTRVIFIGLAAIAVPHILIRAWIGGTSSRAQ